jgi:hypothetical protein
MDSMKKWAINLFTLFLLYHLAVIVLMPNSGSILGRRWGDLIAPYANTLGMNATWEFFSPDPPQAFYFDYSVYFETEDGEEKRAPVEGFFPEWRTERTLHPNKIRLKNAVRFFALTRTSVEQAFIGYLCRQYPEANRVRVRQVTELVPPLEKARMIDWSLEHNRMEAYPVEANCSEVNT